ncbi:hypothetical protein G7054_g11483 [Neopestalotiopsis clavispora]|nr:hypothetical protein G7054_g11483 [Neopestalotiopsis clavispora]
MKPVVGSMQAWSCVVISAFAILILSVIGSLFRNGHHEFLGSTEDPDPKVAGEVASTIFIAVLVYITLNTELYVAGVMGSICGFLQHYSRRWASGGERDGAMARYMEMPKSPRRCLEVAGLSQTLLSSATQRTDDSRPDMAATRTYVSLLALSRRTMDALGGASGSIKSE